MKGRASAAHQQNREGEAVGFERPTRADRLASCELLQKGRETRVTVKQTHLTPKDIHELRQDLDSGNAEEMPQLRLGTRPW